MFVHTFIQWRIFFLHIWQCMYMVIVEVKMDRKKIATTIYITDEQDIKLKKLSQRTKVPVSVYIREGIDMVLHQYSQHIPGQLPLLPRD
jgi:hypothetical protein